MTFNVVALAKNRRPVVIEPITIARGQGASLAGILQQPLALWITHMDRILASYNPTPERVRDALTLDGPEESASAIGGIEDELKVLFLSVGARIRDWTVGVERWHRQRWATSVYSATNVDLRQVMTGTAVTETVEDFVQRNAALMKDLSYEAQGRISDAVYRGYQQRQDARWLAKQIRAAVDMGKDRSLRIAGDQLTKLSAALDKERQLEAGIKLGKYRHSGKKHPRVWHKARNGKFYDLVTRAEVDEKGKKIVGGDKILAEDWPGYPPFCGCRMGAYLPVAATISRRP